MRFQRPSAFPPDPGRLTRCRLRAAALDFTCDDKRIEWKRPTMYGCACMIMFSNQGVSRAKRTVIADSVKGAFAENDSTWTLIVEDDGTKIIEHEWSFVTHTAKSLAVRARSA